MGTVLSHDSAILKNEMETGAKENSLRIFEDRSRKRQRVSHDDDLPSSVSSERVRMAQIPQDGATDTVPCHHEEILKIVNFDLEAMRQLITCKICQRFLYEPYGLACGHTFCYSCLAQWLGPNKKKTCPDCRSIIKHQPTPSYLIREIVLIFVSRGELLPDGETVEEHQKYAKEEAEIVSKDRTNTDQRSGGLFKGCFDRTGRSHLVAIHDPSDNVDRCPQCLNEIEDGYCLQCNVRVRSHDEDHFSESELSEDQDLDHDLADFEEAGFDLDGLGATFYDTDDDPDMDTEDDDDDEAANLQRDVFAMFDHARASRYPAVRRHHPNDDEDDDDDDDDEDDDDSSMNDFLVDDTTQAHIESDSSSDSSESDSSSHGSGSDSTAVAANIGQPRSRQRTARIVLSDDDEDEDDDDDESTNHQNDQSSEMDPSDMNQTSEGDTSESEDDSEDEAPIHASSQRSKRQRLGLAQRPIVADSGEDEEEDEDDDNDNESRSDTISSDRRAEYFDAYEGPGFDHDFGENEEELDDEDDGDTDRGEILGDGGGGQYGDSHDEMGAYGEEDEEEDEGYPHYGYYEGSSDYWCGPLHDTPYSFPRLR